MAKKKKQKKEIQEISDFSKLEQVDMFSNLDPMLDPDYIEYKNSGGTADYNDWVNNKDYYHQPEQLSFDNLEADNNPKKIKEKYRKRKKKPEKEKYSSKNTGGRKQREANRKKQQKLIDLSEGPIPNINDVNDIIATRDDAMFNSPEYQAYEDAMKFNKEVERWNKLKTENMYSNMFDNIERAEYYKSAVSIGREEIKQKATQNIIDGLDPILGDAANLKEGHAKITEYVRNNKLNKANSKELHDFLNSNHKQIFTPDRANILKQQAASVAEEVVSEGIEDLGETNIGKIFNKRTFSVGLNSFFAISDYKSAREEGKGVVGSVVKAGATFVAGEILGPAYPLIGLAKAAPKMVIGGVETMQRMTRQMNSVQRIQTFGEAQFQDTQQLATMRQAGMELAKMSQYNLQQSIMGNEAQYMHRI